MTRKFLTEVFATILGLFLIYGGYCDGEKPSAILIGLGCSLLASAVVSFFAALFYAKVNKTVEVVSFWGLNDIFKTREVMNKKCDVTFEKMHEHLDVIAWGLKSFRRSDKAKIPIQEKLQNGLRVRILTPHPDSIFVQQLDIDEKKDLR